MKTSNLSYHKSASACKIRLEPMDSSSSARVFCYCRSIRASRPSLEQASTSPTKLGASICYPHQAWRKHPLPTAIYGHSSCRHQRECDTHVHVLSRSTFGIDHSFTLLGHRYCIYERTFSVGRTVCVVHDGQWPPHNASYSRYEAQCHWSNDSLIDGAFFSRRLRTID